MDILFLAQIIPYPPDAGPKVKTWHVLRYLAEQGHRVTLAAFVRPEELPYLPQVQAVCHAVHTVPIKRSRPADLLYLLRSQLTGRPFLIERDDLAAMRRLVARLLAENDMDAIHADQLTMTQFAFSERQMPTRAGHRQDRPLLVFDAHNAVWTIVRRLLASVPVFLRPFLHLEAGRIKRYEGQIVSGYDITLTVAEPDRQALLEAVAVAGGQVDDPARRLPVIPIAVDTEALPLARRPSGGSNILTLGTLHYPPNADGIRWFARQIFPLVQQQVPDATLTIIGKNPPADLQQLAQASSGAITVTGYVPDLDPYMDQANVVVVPVRAGGGIRVRILEAFARGMPVVTTTVGLEGIDARPGEEVLVADSPADFAAATAALLQDEARQAALAAAGRRLVERAYDWRVVLRQMEAVYN